MERFEIQATQKMPKVIIDPEYGLFEICGNSIPEDAGVFYKNILKKLEEYFLAPHPLTIVNISLRYYNTSTARWLFNLFKAIKRNREQGHEIFIKWYYDDGDEESYGTAVDYSKLLNIPIRLLKAS